MIPFGIIYCSFNQINGKYYVGQTTGFFSDRKKSHEKSMLSKKPFCRAFVNALNKHGKDSFVWSILTEVFTGQDELNEAEKYWGNFLNSLVPNGYNLKECGGAKGKMSLETKLKISQSLRDQQWSEQRKQKHALRLRKLNESRKGRPLSDEHKRKLSETAVAKGITPPSWKGVKRKPRTDEHRRKLSESLRKRSRVD